MKKFWTDLKNFYQSPEYEELLHQKKHEKNARLKYILIFGFLAFAISMFLKALLGIDNDLLNWILVAFAIAGAWSMGFYTSRNVKDDKE